MPFHTEWTYKAVVSMMDLLTGYFPEAEPFRMNPFRVLISPGINGPMNRTGWKKTQHNRHPAPANEFLDKVSTGHKGLEYGNLTVPELEG